VVRLRFPSARLAPLLTAPIHVPRSFQQPCPTAAVRSRPRPTRAPSTQVRLDLRQRYTFVALCDTGGTAQRHIGRGRERCEARGPALLAGHGSHVLGMARRALLPVGGSAHDLMDRESQHLSLITDYRYVLLSLPSAL
jgi:hypothetical protein